MHPNWLLGPQGTQGCGYPTCARLKVPSKWHKTLGRGGRGVVYFCLRGASQTPHPGYQIGSGAFIQLFFKWAQMHLNWLLGPQGTQGCGYPTCARLKVPSKWHKTLGRGGRGVVYFCLRGVSQTPHPGYQIGSGAFVQPSNEPKCI